MQSRSGLHLTHVTFSPNGQEILLSYSGEHVYLMDANIGTIFNSTKIEIIWQIEQYFIIVSDENNLYDGV